MRRSLFIISITLILSALLAVFLRSSGWGEALHWKIYEKLLKIEMNFVPPPPQIKNIVLVSIGNQTLIRVKKRWPFPRSYFARVIDNLRQAGARVIAFDFVFLGESGSGEDAQLRAAIEKSRVVMATAINENGMVELFSLPDLAAGVPAGFTNKLQDRDGLTRRNLTYLVNERQPTSGLLSWEMQILREAKDIAPATLKTVKGFVRFSSRKGERWAVPVAASTNSFLIHFRAHTDSFARIPFYWVLENNFDPASVKDKIVLIGPVSNLLGDIHLTPIGWLPGLTLNANAFLNLYTHDFIREVPVPWQFLIMLAALALSAFFLSRYDNITGNLFIALEIIIFFMLSYLLLRFNYIWNYAFFPVLVTLCPVWARRLARIKKRWT
jgi:adenylate cyclase